MLSNTDLKVIFCEHENIHDCAEDVLHSENNSSISDSSYDLLAEYMENWDNYKDAIDCYRKEYKKFCELRKKIKNWLAIIGLQKVENEDEILTGYKETEDIEEQELKEPEAILETSDDSEETNTVQNQIRDLIRIIENDFDFDNLEHRGFSSDGIFCLIGDRIFRSSVESYRSSTEWR